MLHTLTYSNSYNEVLLYTLHTAVQLHNTAVHQQNPMPSSTDPVGIPVEDEEVALPTTSDSPYRVSDTPQGDVRDDVSDAGSSSSSSSSSSDDSSSRGRSEGTYTGGEEALRATLALAAAAAAAAPAAPYLRFGQLRMAVRCRLADTALLLPQSSTAVANISTSTNARRSSDSSSSASSVGGNCLALCLEGQLDVHSGLDDETAAIDITRCALLPVVFGCDGAAAARVLANRCEVSHLYTCIMLFMLF
jgi:hypothetical protein